MKEGSHTQSSFEWRLICIILIFAFLLLLLIFVLHGVRLICIGRLQESSVHLLNVALQVIVRLGSEVTAITLQ